MCYGSIKIGGVGGRGRLEEWKRVWVEGWKDGGLYGLEEDSTIKDECATETLHTPVLGINCQILSLVIQLSPLKQLFLNGVFYENRQNRVVFYC